MTFILIRSLLKLNWAYTIYIYFLNYVLEPRWKIIRIVKDFFLFLKFTKLVLDKVPLMFKHFQKSYSCVLIDQSQHINICIISK